MTSLDENAGKEADEKELYDAFTELGSDPELSDASSHLDGRFCCR